MRPRFACAFQLGLATAVAASGSLAFAADDPASPAGVRNRVVDGALENIRPCPTRAAVLAKLVDEASRRANFEVDSAGTLFFVFVDGKGRSFDDTGYDCERRATLAAVAITSMVSPPRGTDLGPMATGAVPAPARVKSPSNAPPTIRAVRTHPWHLAAGAITELSPGSSDHDATVFTGLQLRAAYRPHAIGASIGIATFAPQTFTASGARAQMTRLVPDLSVQFAHTIRPFDLRATLGPAFEIHQVGGTNDATTAKWRALLGVKAACGSAFSLNSTIALQLDVSALVLPGPGDLALHSRGMVGKEPSLFFGLGAGLVFSL